MNGPSAGYLADIWAPFAAGEQLAGVGKPSAQPVMSGTPLAPVAQPPPNAGGFPSLTDLANTPPPEVPIAQPPPPPPPPVQPPPPEMSLPTDNPGANMSSPPPMMSQGPTIQTGAQPAPMGPPPPPPGPDPNAFPLVSAGGSGTIPAHEVEKRGPSLLGAQAARNEAVDSANNTVGDRSQQAAAAEYGMALQQEREAREREAAQQQSLAERAEEMQQRQDDFDATTQQLSKLGTVDPHRYWSTRTTVGKIAGFAELMLAGFRGAPSMMMKAADDDVKAQEFAFYAARDAANAKQTAFSMAMNKYQNADAARAAARASAIDVMQAQLGQIAAQWKGTDAANRATEAAAQLQNEKMLQIQAGIQFVPTQRTGRVWVDPRTGLTYNEAEAKALMAKRDEWGQADRTEAARVGGQLLVEGAKNTNNTQQQKDQGERSVVVDGKDALAVNKTAAEKWNEYNHGRAVFAMALDRLKEARKAGDVGAYDAARAQLIEEYPKLLGYTRAPSEGQISHTVGPNAIPEYNHWYNHASTLGATYPMAQGRAAEKIKFLEDTLATSDKKMRENTFGAAAGPPKPMPGSFGGYKK